MAKADEEQPADKAIRMPLRLLVELNRFACKDDTRFHIYGVQVLKDELAATDGHRLVRIPISHDLIDAADDHHADFLIPRSLILMANAAFHAIKTARTRYVVIDRTDKNVTIRLDDDEHDAVVSVAASMPAIYPPLDKVMVPSGSGAPPDGYMINPQFFDDINAVMDALGGPKGVKITGWIGHRDPMQLEGDSVRFVLMPMAESPDVKVTRMMRDESP